MTPRSWAGIGLAVMLFTIFGMFAHKCAITSVAGWAFGGGALFCGILIDAEDFKDVLNTVRGKPSFYPPPPGGQEGKFPTGDGK